MRSVRIHVGDVDLDCEWNDSPTANLIHAALPIDARGSYWGGEIYCEIPVHAQREESAREVVEPGTVAYWPDGSCLCVFWGPTPATQGDECRAASPVNIIGRVVNAEILPSLSAHNIRIEAAG
jgi:hypothetical protein